MRDAGERGPVYYPLARACGSKVVVERVPERGARRWWAVVSGAARARLIYSFIDFGFYVGTAV